MCCKEYIVHSNGGVKTRSVEVFDHRVGNILVGQAWNTSQQAINRNPQGGYSNRQAGNFEGQARMSIMKTMTI